MQNLYFNKIYVIESLRAGDRKTGTELYDDLLRYQELKFPNLKVGHKPINNASEWNVLMEEIAVDCEQNGSQVILHLEIHGEKTGKGLVLGNGDFLSYEDIRPQFVRINKASQCNLFLTLAVCKGLNVAKIGFLSQPMPFCGVLGSFNTIYDWDLALRFNEFYDELFTSFDLAKAYARLQNANPDMPSVYRFDHADMHFCREYQRYINNSCNKDVIKQRALEAAEENGREFLNRHERRDFQRKFEEQEKRTRQKYFREAANSFFMLDEFPENKERFDVPSNLEELKKRAEPLL